MSTQAIAGDSLYCADRATRRSALQAGAAATPRRDASEFQSGMPEKHRWELAAGRFVALPSLNATLVCLEGELWLTRDGDIEDYILGAGSTLHLHARDQAFVQALKPSRMRLIPA